MVRLLSFLKVFIIVTLVFQFFQAGTSRELVMRSSKGVATTVASHMFQESEEIMKLDYDDAGPNTNDRSVFTQPFPTQEPPSPRD
ncbi:hypothetical protein M8C21_000864 [Ambrosia artemisiifolia]|uniref:Uncharacterized protein n=1 Tax=Ambrosia artemisiifolia TaxID=4212 RepID=A0AAD5CH50_AMBAR|nr:hypothetical protein M8C21_000864 [Ambrosia artemisiifolia]